MEQMLRDGSYLVENYSQAQFQNLILRLLPQPRLSHPNLFFVKSQKNIGIGQIREIKRFLALKNWQNGRRVVAIADGDNLTIPAQNALLKILEEPGQLTTIVIQTNNSQRLLPTIRSRCQLLRQASQKEDGRRWENFLVEITKSSPRKRLQLIGRAQLELPAPVLLDRLLQASQQLLYRASAAQMPLLQAQTKAIVTSRQMLAANLKAEDAFDWLIMNL